VGFDAPVTVKGKPRLVLSDGKFAEYAGGSGSETLVFNRTETSAGEVAAVELNGGAVFASESAATLRMAQLSLPAR